MGGPRITRSLTQRTIGWPERVAKPNWVLRKRRAFDGYGGNGNCKIDSKVNERGEGSESPGYKAVELLSRTDSVKASWRIQEQ